LFGHFVRYAEYTHLPPLSKTLKGYPKEHLIL